MLQLERDVRSRLWLVACTTLLLGIVSTAMLSAQDSTAEQAPTVPLSIWNKDGIDDFSFTDRSGQTVTKKDLLGKEWVIGFMFTRCPSICPKIIGNMKILQDQTGVNLVVLTVDPDFDTPERMQRYSQALVAEPEPNEQGLVPKWYWLTGEKETIRGYIQKNFLVPAHNQNGGPEHSNCVMHLDETGHVLGKYLFEEQGPETTLLRKIIQKEEVRGKMLRNLIPDGAIQVAGAPPGLRFTRTKDVADDESAPSNPDQSSAENVSEHENVPSWVRNLPAVNASLNGLATVLLIIGFVLIKAKRVAAHKTVMISCFVTSIVFLGSYLIYHAFVLSKKFPGTGPVRTIYFAILISHVILAATVPVLASMTIYRGLTGQWARHKAIARITFPIWLYVSVTGVVIYLMLYQMPVA